jgi:hypothetical protein
MAAMQRCVIATRQGIFLDEKIRMGSVMGRAMARLVTTKQSPLRRPPSLGKVGAWTPLSIYILGCDSLTGAIGVLQRWVR